MNDPLSRAEILCELGKYEQAIDQLHKALAVEPNSVEARVYLAHCHAETGNSDRALEIASDAVSLAPESDATHGMVARILFLRGEFDESEKAIVRAIEIFPDNAEYFATRGAIQVKKRQFKTACQMAGHGLSLDPINVNCLLVRGNAELLTLDPGAAKLTFQEVLRLDPENSRAHLGLGTVATMQSGSVKRARSHRSDALKIDPNLLGALDGSTRELKSKSGACWLLFGALECLRAFYDHIITGFAFGTGIRRSLSIFAVLGILVVLLITYDRAFAYSSRSIDLKVLFLVLSGLALLLLHIKSVHLSLLAAFPSVRSAIPPAALKVALFQSSMFGLVFASVIGATFAPNNHFGFTALVLLSLEKPITRLLSCNSAAKRLRLWGIVLLLFIAAVVSGMFEKYLIYVLAAFWLREASRSIADSESA